MTIRVSKRSVINTACAFRPEFSVDAKKSGIYNAAWSQDA
jgi:hypothetical protein